MVAVRERERARKTSERASVSGLLGGGSGDHTRGRGGVARAWRSGPASAPAPPRPANRCLVARRSGRAARARAIRDSWPRAAKARGTPASPRPMLLPVGKGVGRNRRPRADGRSAAGAGWEGAHVAREGRAAGARARLGLPPSSLSTLALFGFRPPPSPPRGSPAAAPASRMGSCARTIHGARAPREGAAGPENGAAK